MNLIFVCFLLLLFFPVATITVIVHRTALFFRTLPNTSLKCQLQNAIRKTDFSNYDH